MLLVELTGATSEVGLLRWIFIPVSSAPALAHCFLMGVWGVGANQLEPKYVRRALPHPLQHRPPNSTQTGWVFAVGLQKPANLVGFGFRQEGLVVPDKARA